MFELMILLVVIIMAWWLITAVALLATRAFRRVRLARVAETVSETVAKPVPQRKSS